MNAHDVELVLPAGAGPGTTVKIGDNDVTNHVQSLDLRAGVGGPARLYLDLVVPGVTVARGQMEVHITDSLREALIALGWVPPEQARALLSRHTDTPTPDPEQPA